MHFLDDAGGVVALDAVELRKQAVCPGPKMNLGFLWVSKSIAPALLARPLSRGPLKELVEAAGAGSKAPLRAAGRPRPWDSAKRPRPDRPYT